MRSRWILYSLLLLPLLLTSTPSFAVDDGGAALRALADSARTQAADGLKACAAQQGLAASGEAVLLSTQDTASAIMPLAGVETLTRADLEQWTKIGIVTLSGPAGADAPSGTYTVQVRVDPGANTGEYQFVDDLGIVVQNGELSISDEPVESQQPAAPAAVTSNDPTALPLEHPNAALQTVTGANHLGPYCYYPLYYPFRIYPYYYHACYWWYYRWPWGFLRFRWCWWPTYYWCTRWFRCCCW